MIFGKISQIKGIKPKGCSIICTDPHGQFICIYYESYNILQIIQTTDIQKYFLKEAINFNKPQENKLEAIQISSQKLFQKNDRVVHIIEISKIYQNQQIVAVCDLFDLKVIKILKRQQNGKIYISNIIDMKLSVESPILDFKIIQNSIYVTLYDRSIKIYSRNNIGTFKRNKQIIHMKNQMIRIAKLPNDQIFTQSSRKHKLKFSYKIIYESLKNQLQISTISNQNITDCTKICSLFKRPINFQQLQDEQQYYSKYKYNKLRYQLSLCQNFVICLVSNKQFKIRCRKMDWKIVKSFQSYPYINHFFHLIQTQIYRQFWYKYGAMKFSIIQSYLKSNFDFLLTATIHQKLSHKSIYQVDQNKNKVDQKTEICISLIRISLNDRKIVPSYSKQSQQSQQINDSYEHRTTESLLYRIKNIKCNILSVHWICDNQIIVRAEQDHIFYYNFFNQQIKLAVQQVWIQLLRKADILMEEDYMLKEK